MTNVAFYKKGGHIVRFTVSGHCGFSERGRDIVCASISSAAWLVANGLEKLAGANVSQREDMVCCELPGGLSAAQRKTADDLLQSFIWFVDSLIGQYGEFISKTEV